MPEVSESPARGSWLSFRAVLRALALAGVFVFSRHYAERHRTCSANLSVNYSIESSQQSSVVSGRVSYHGRTDATDIRLCSAGPKSDGPCVALFPSLAPGAEREFSVSWPQPLIPELGLDGRCTGLSIAEAEKQQRDHAQQVEELLNGVRVSPEAVDAALRDAEAPAPQPSTR